MSERYSYLVQFERNDNSPDEEMYFNNEDEAEEYFRKFDDPEDKDLRCMYRCISLIEVDWIYRANRNLDGITFVHDED